MKASRLLFVQPSSVFESYGGAEYYWDDLLVAASRLLGNENVKTLVPRKTSGFELAARPYSVEVVPFSSKLILRKIQNRYSIPFLKRLLELVREFRPSAIVCCHVSLGPLVYLVRRLTGVPYMVTVLGIESWGDLFPQDEWCLRRADHIISISDWTKNILISRGYSGETISVVHPTLNESYEQLPLPERTLTDRPVRLLTLSRLDPAERYKGQDHVLAALKILKEKHPELQLEYTIQGNGSDRGWLEGLVRDYGLGEWVNFRPAAKDRNDLKGLYAETDLFVMPSRFGKWDGKWRGEGFGIVYVEAGAFGVPSIAYNCGGATDIIRSGESGVLVPQDDTQRLAEEIYKLITDRKALLEMGKTAYQVAMQNFTPTVMRSQLRECIAKI